MSNIILTVVLAVCVTCMYLAQHKSIPATKRRLYSLLGSIAAIMLAVEAGHRDQTNVMVVFTLAALISLASLALDFLKPSNPDA